MAAGVATPARPSLPLVDANKDGAVTRDEMKATFDKWFTDWDSAKAGALTQAELLAGLNAALPAPPPPAGGFFPGAGPAAQPQTPDAAHVQAMLAALPAKAPAKPKQPRKVLVLSKAGGFVHSSIPLAGKTIEEMGKKTGAWSTTITFDPADINEANLKQYDAIFLASTTGAFLDDRERPRSHGGAQEGAPRLRAQRQGPRGHPRGDGLLSSEPAVRRRSGGRRTRGRSGWPRWRRRTRRAGRRCRRAVRGAGRQERGSEGEP